MQLEEAPERELTRNYECSNAKLADRLGFIPSHSVVDAITHLLEQIDELNR